MTEKEPISKREFYEICKNHDWYYMRSDDQANYHKGRKESIRIHDLITKYPGAFSEIYDSWRKHKFYGDKEPVYKNNI